MVLFDWKEYYWDFGGILVNYPPEIKYGWEVPRKWASIDGNSIERNHDQPISIIDFVVGYPNSGHPHMLFRDTSSFYQFFLFHG